MLNNTKEAKFRNEVVQTGACLQLAQLLLSEGAVRYETAFGRKEALPLLKFDDSFLELKSRTEDGMLEILKKYRKTGSDSPDDPYLSVFYGLTNPPADEIGLAVNRRAQEVLKFYLDVLQENEKRAELSDGNADADA